MFDKKSKVWFNGKIVNAEDVNVGIFTHALHYGTAIFEGCRAYNGKVFKMREHNERLINSGILVDTPVPYSAKELDDATILVLRENGWSDAYIRPIAWRGDENLGVKSKENSVNVAIFAWQWGSYFGEDKIKAGINLATTKYVRPDPRSTETQAKASGLYFIGSKMQNQCSHDGYDDVLMLDWQGYIAECTSCNVFFIRGDELHTPIPNCFLNGITRQTVIELASKMGYKIFERKIMPQELSSFDEAFTTGTAVEVMPVNSIFDVYKFESKELVLKIRSEYLKLVNS